MNIINGNRRALEIRQALRKQIIAKNETPGLAVILVGNDEGSRTYVELKKKAAEEMGIMYHLYRFDSEARQQEIEETIHFLNNDPEIDGILVQLPLPPHLNEDALINGILPLKDADGFHKKNIQAFVRHEKDALAPGLVEGIMDLILQTHVPLKGKTAYIVANASVFAITMAELLSRHDIRSKTMLKPTIKDLPQLRDADIIIVIVGKTFFIEAGYIKNDAIIIDAGYNRENGEPCGDVHTDSFRDTDVFITPVPGGVGPMTVAMLLRRVIHIYEKRQ